MRRMDVRRDIVPIVPRPSDLAWPILNGEDPAISAQELAWPIGKYDHISELGRTLAILKRQLREVVLTRLDQDQCYFWQIQLHGRCL